MKPSLLDRLRSRALMIHLLAVGLMLLASPVMVQAVRSDNSTAFWTGLGAFILANLLECLIP